MAEHRKPHVWFTMSGVLAATAFPSAEDPGRMEMQMPGDKWPEFHDGEDYNLHEHCQPVRPVIEYLRRLKDQDYSVGLVTDDYRRARNAMQRGMPALHIANMIAGMAEPGGNMFPKM